MDTISTLQIVLSAAFILFGCSVFYISSLVSGKNIYRDLPTSISTTVTSIVGFLIFMFNPIAYIILTPEVFGIVKDKYIQQVIVRIIENGILPYILFSSGFGVVFGCMNIVDPRTTTILWLRQKTSLSIPITNYNLSWDDYLRSLKPRALISISYGQERVRGFLRFYSLRCEPKQVTMETLVKEDQTPVTEDADFYFGTYHASKLLVIENAQITSIAADERQFKRHEHHMYHQTQALFWVLSAIGCILLFLGTDMIGNFMRIKTFYKILYLYNASALMFLLLAAFQVWYSLLLSKIDYSSWYSSFVLSPFTVKSCILLVVPIVFGLYHWLNDFYFILCLNHEFFRKYQLCETWLLAIAVIITAASLFLFDYIRRKNYKVLDLYEDLEKVIPKEKLRRLVRYLVGTTNLNDRQSQHPDELKKSLCKAAEKYPEFIDCYVILMSKIEDFINSSETSFLGKYQYLKNEEFNMILYLNLTLVRKG